MESQFHNELSVYHRLKNSILKQEYGPKERLIESVIAEKFGVSRTPIREALRKLSYEGLVDIIPNQGGVFVSQPSLEEMIQIFSCRMLIERETTKKATQAITPKDIECLEKIAERQREIYTGNRVFFEFFDNNIEFHMIIAKKCNNIYYIKYLEELLNRGNLYLLYFDKFQSTNLDESLAVKEHSRIINALKAKNVDESGNAMYDHIKTTYLSLSRSMLELMGPSSL
jgi:DNA-binding GntR family transcriptional regulator